jgi:hypothetical protein
MMLQALSISIVEFSIKIIPVLFVDGSHRFDVYEVIIRQKGHLWRYPVPVL